MGRIGTPPAQRVVGEARQTATRTGTRQTTGQAFHAPAKRS